MIRGDIYLALQGPPGRPHMNHLKLKQEFAISLVQALLKSGKATTYTWGSTFTALSDAGQLRLAREYFDQACQEVWRGRRGEWVFGTEGKCGGLEE